MERIAKSALILTAITLFAACNTPQYLFEHEKFTLELPAEFTEEKGEIAPVQEDAFPTIIFSTFDDPVAPEDMLAEEEKTIGFLCTETDACPTITYDEEVTVNNTRGLRLTREITGRSLSEPEGFVRTFSFYLSNEEQQVNFLTWADDQEQPDQKEAKFASIIETVKFK